MALTKQQHISVITSLVEEAGGEFCYVEGLHPAYRVKDKEWIMLGNDPNFISLERALKRRVEDLPPYADKTGAVAAVKDARWLGCVLDEVDADERCSTPQQAMDAFIQKLERDGGMIRGPNAKTALSAVFLNHRGSVDRQAALSLKGACVMRKSHHNRPRVHSFEPEQVATRGGIATLNDHGKKGLLARIEAVAKQQASSPQGFQLALHHLFYCASLAVDYKGHNLDPATWPRTVSGLFEQGRQHYAKKQDPGVFSQCLECLNVRFSPLGINLHRQSPQDSLTQLKQRMATSKTRSTPEHQDVEPTESVRIRRKVALLETLQLNDNLSCWARILPYLYQGKQLEHAREQLKDLTDAALPFTHPKAHSNLASLCQQAEALFGQQWEATLRAQKDRQLRYVTSTAGDNPELLLKVRALQAGAPEPRTFPDDALCWLESVNAYLRKGEGGTGRKVAGNVTSPTGQRP